MDMGIVEARENGILMRIDDAGFGAGQRLDVGGGTNRNDVVLKDGDGPNLRTRRVHRSHGGVNNNKVGGKRNRCRRSAESEHGTEEGEN